METKSDKIALNPELTYTPPINQVPPLVNGVLVFHEKLGEIGSVK